MGHWLGENWFNLFSSAGIIGSFCFTAVSLRSETKTRRVANLLAITANYREVWKEFFRSPKVARVIDPSADITKQPITPAEEFFVHMVISHTSSMYEALKDELVTKQEGLRRDIRSFFSLPVPNAVWCCAKRLQNQDFAAFIESSLKAQTDSPGLISPKISSLPTSVVHTSRSPVRDTMAKSWERGETITYS